MIFIERIRSVLSSVRYLDWEFNIGDQSMDNPSLYLTLKDSEGGKQVGRKWRLSQHMTTSEIVQTAFKAVITAEEHEIRERFLYKNAAVFGPHFNVDFLASCCERKVPKILDVRIG